MALDQFSYRTLARRNPYGSLGPSPRTVRRITPPKKRTVTARDVAPPPPFDPFAQATSSVESLIEQMLAQVQAQQDEARRQAEAEAQLEVQRGQALAQGLQQLGISQAIQDAFQSAGANQAALAQGYSGAIRDTAAADAAAQQHLLSGTGQEGAVRNQGANMGNVTYGVGGAIPASSLNTAGAAFGAQAALQPGFAQQIGALEAANRRAEFARSELPQFLNQRLDIIAQKPALFQDMLQNIVNLRKLTEGETPEKKIELRELANGQIQRFVNGRPSGKPVGPAEAADAPEPTKLSARTLADGRVQWFDPTTGQAVGGPQGPKRKTTKKGRGGQTYNLQLKDFGSYAQWYDPRTGKPVGPRIKSPSATKKKSEKKSEPAKRLDEGGRITGRTDGVTPTQARDYKAAAYGWAKQWHNNGEKVDLDGELVHLTPLELLSKLVNEGQIPYDLAVRQMARFSPAARGWIKSGVNPLTGQSTRQKASKRVPASNILPASWKGTHVSDGLGWGTRTAVDLFPGPPGTAVGSPISGTVVYFHPDGAQGGGSLLIRGDDGYEYWIGHVDNGVPAGTRVSRGSQIALVSGRHPTPHVHIDRRYLGTRA